MRYKKYGIKKLNISGTLSTISDCISGIKKIIDAAILKSVSPVKAKPDLSEKFLCTKFTIENTPKVVIAKNK